MLAIQWTVVAALSACAAFFAEPREWTIQHIITFMPLLLFLAVSEGLGFVLMALAQSYTPPTQTAIILSLEGVFTSIARY
jgi:drug/metabolite transporter (DMT)-like permease